MLLLQEYVNDPCGTLSVPYWKSKELVVPENMKIIHDRMQGIAEFATVSGKVNNPTNPQSLYRKCGFIGDDVWHILTQK